MCGILGDFVDEGFDGVRVGGDKTFDGQPSLILLLQLLLASSCLRMREDLRSARIRKKLQ